jgi:hypothetical protein
MSLRPVTTEDVSSKGVPGLTVDVDGDEVEIGREWDRNAEELEEEEEEDEHVEWTEDVLDEVSLAAGCSPTRVTGLGVSGFRWVWILVLTTSSGQVKTPAMPPAVVAVKISRPKPISRWPTHCLAHCCSCS